ncbi:spore germination protein YaaH [Catenibacillus scindens]|uniref:Spore germination protein YaaH n=1 Tax=Catenibacillus scindens TaxID=673271 RepID=A0A7W8HE15_9FIRM|nr:glycosyl hydrolase family 18 protein [Catenibacillus scindens]MBB5265962.1 spore germination protein YaaH [Catenibacillus scindens]
MKNRVVPVLITLVLIIVVGIFTAISLINNYRKGSTEFVDFEETYELDENQYVVVLNDAIQDYRGIEDGGSVYISAQAVADSINDRFYWDSNEHIFIYTTATQVIKAYPDEQAYHVGDETVSLDYVPVKTIDGTVYVSVNYIQEYTQCEVESFSDPNRLVLTTQWGDKTAVTASEDTVLRLAGDLQSDILKDVTAGETVTVVASEEDWSWTNVVTDDGYVGWIENRYLGDTQTVTTQAPPFQEEEFTYIKEEGTICYAWHQMTTEELSGVNYLIQALNNTSSINIIGPTWFSFDGTDGHVRSIGNADYVNYAHQVGVKVWAVFQNQATPGGEMNGINTDNILAYTFKRETLVSEVISYALEYGIDGINLDFEMILEEGADNYIQFIRELSVACRNNGLCFSIDNYVPLYTQHYDRAEQALFADYLVIMGYDEYGAFSSEPGPGASLPYVQQGIEDTLALIGGDSSKVINAIPFYTNVWEDDGVNPAGLNTTATMPEARSYLQRYPESTVITWNSELGYNYCYYTSPLNGSQISMWLEDADSIAAKLELMDQYDLAGVAIWKLQQESADVWTPIAAYVNGETIPTHERQQEAQAQSQ